MDSLKVDDLVKVCDFVLKIAPFLDPDTTELCRTFQVEWKESGSQFSGVIKSVNENGTYDVLYDEKVGGKACVEKQVEPDRIEPPSAIPMDMHIIDDKEEPIRHTMVTDVSFNMVGSIEADYWTETNVEAEPYVESYKSTTDRSKLVSKLLQVSLRTSRGPVR